MLKVSSGNKRPPGYSLDPRELVNHAAALLGREALRPPSLGDSREYGPASAAPIPDYGYGADLRPRIGSTCPVSGATRPAVGEPQQDLRSQAHELLAALFSTFGERGSYASAPYGFGGKQCPVTKAAVPPAALDKDAIRRQAHEFIDTLLVTFREATGEDGVVAENRIPQLQCAAPAAAGSTALASLTVSNEEAVAAEVTLYSTNFVADNGYEIPSLRVAITPRVAHVTARDQVRFEIRVAVPPQCPAGNYSGLIQAMGSKYVKAVLTVVVV